MTENILKLERRGCPFTGNMGRKEAENSDFDNFRYLATVQGVRETDKGRKYYIEITIHERWQFDGFVTAYLDYSYDTPSGFCYAYREANGYFEPTRAAVLKAINTALGTDFNKIELEG